MRKSIGIVIAIFAVMTFAQDSARLIAQPFGELAFTVPAHAAKQYTFTVPAGASRVNLEGHFVATGGPRNSIEVWVMNDDQFANWENRHPLRALYASQRVTQGTIKLALPSEPGVYHVVFDNKFSVLTPKAVEASLTLMYAK